MFHKPLIQILQVPITMGCLSFLLGAWLACFTQPNHITELVVPVLFWVVWVCLAAIVLLWLLLKNAAPILCRQVMFLICFCLGGLYAAGLQSVFQIPHQHALSQLPHYFSGQAVLESPGKNPSQWRVRLTTVDTEHAQTLTVMALFKRSAHADTFQVGEHLELSGSFELPQPAAFPGGFDAQQYNRQQGIDGTYWVDNATLDAAQPISWWHQVMRLTLQTRDRLIDVFHQALAEDDADLMASVVLGERAVHIDKDLKSQFIRSGLIHLLAASGLNVGLIALFFIGSGHLLRLPQPVYLIITIVGVGLYCLMTGLPPSIQRAGVMLLLALLFKLMKRELRPVTLLSMAGFLLILVNPLLTHSLSFQLSFLSTLGLVTMAGPLQSKLSFYLSDRLAGMLLVPLIAQLWVFPLIWFIFGQIQVVSVVANIAAFPLATLVTWSGFILGALSLVLPDLAVILIRIAGFSATGLRWVANWFGASDWSVLNVPAPPSLWVVLFYWLILIWALWLAFPKPFGILGAQKGRITALAAVLSLVLCLPIPLQAMTRKQPSMALLPHRYGEISTVLLQPSVLITVDRLTPSVARDLSQYLQAVGKKQIDLLIVRHPSNSTQDALALLDSAHHVQKTYLTQQLPDSTHGKLTHPACCLSQPVTMPFSLWQTPVGYYQEAYVKNTKNTQTCLGAGTTDSPLFSPLAKRCAWQWNQGSGEFTNGSTTWQIKQYQAFSFPS